MAQTPCLSPSATVTGENSLKFPDFSRRKSHCGLEPFVAELVDARLPQSFSPSSTSNADILFGNLLHRFTKIPHPLAISRSRLIINGSLIFPGVHCELDSEAREKGARCNLEVFLGGAVEFELNVR
ncbi:hypothetical protein Droror1_Dr00005770, partial [Drosera rotundifolia]